MNVPADREPATARGTGRPLLASAPGAGDLERAMSVLARDGLVAFPTETVWGVAACATSAGGVARLRAFKGREEQKPISVLVSSIASFEACAPEQSDPARALARHFWPGPLTLVVRCGLALAPGVAGPAGGTGFRCSPHPVAAALARAAEERGMGPLTATSLNRGGELPAATHADAERLIGGGDGPALSMQGEAGGAQPSTVVDATGPELVVLREGAIPASALFKAVAECREPCAETSVE